jgi:hypothetical protein
MKRLFDGNWHRLHGTWWMLTWAWDGWLSLGIHVDFRHRRRQGDNYRYSFGPYVDLHLGFVVLSLGRRPYYAFRYEELQSHTALPREQG